MICRLNWYRRYSMSRNYSWQPNSGGLSSRMAAFQPLVDHPMRFLGGEGPAVKFIACAQDDATNAGDDEVELLLAEGWRPEDVALLTTGTRHPEQKERQAGGNAAYWDSFWDADQVFYGHVLGFKGLERRAVVLVVNEVSAFERSRERLYVGLSRARDQLVVCGDPDFIRDVGGPDLAHRLNGNEGSAVCADSRGGDHGDTR